MSRFLAVQVHLGLIFLQGSELGIHVIIRKEKSVTMAPADFHVSFTGSFFCHKSAF